MSKKNKPKKKMTEQQRRSALGQVLGGLSRKMICINCGRVAWIGLYTSAEAEIKGDKLHCRDCGEATLRRLNSS